MKKLLSFLKEYWGKIILIILLAVSCGVVSQFSFPKIDAFIRDSLQFTNSLSRINHDLVSFNINLQEHPMTLKTIQPVIEALEAAGAKSIILCLEPLDITEKRIEKIKIFDYLLKKKNVFLNGYESRNTVTTFATDEIFQKYPRLLDFNVVRDSRNGYKQRRAVLDFKFKGEAPLIKELTQVGINSKPPSYFQYSWPYWETSQVYIKSFPLGTYGYYQSSDLYAKKTPSEVFKNKVVFVGTHDEYSYLALPSVLNIFDNTHPQNLKAYATPFQDIVANLVNLYSTGDYIKYIPNFEDVALIFIIMLVLILIKLDLHKKIYLFLSLLPIVILVQIVLYISTDYYINFSRSLVFLFTTQYLALPVLMLSLYKKQEKLRIEEITAARIDAFLSIAEKVAHDIRSPLSAINLVLKKVQFHNAEYKEIILNSLNRIDQIAADNLTKYSTASSPVENLSLSNLISLITTIVEEKKTLNSSIQYTLTSIESMKGSIAVSQLEFLRTLSNIIDNAIYELSRDTHSLPKITIDIQESTPYLSIAIKDNGKGIPPEILAIIGKQRITTKIKNDGNGIGLLHAKRSIEKMDGKFEITSTDQGTQIHILLRMVRQPLAN